MFPGSQTGSHFEKLWNCTNNWAVWLLEILTEFCTVTEKLNMSVLCWTPIWCLRNYCLSGRVPPLAWLPRYTSYQKGQSFIGMCEEAIWYTWVYVSFLTIYLVGTVRVRANSIYLAYMNEFPTIYLPSWVRSSGTIRGEPFDICQRYEANGRWESYHLGYTMHGYM